MTHELDKTWVTIRDNYIAWPFGGDDNRGCRIVFERDGMDVAYIPPTADDDNGNKTAKRIVESVTKFEALESDYEKSVGDNVKLAKYASNLDAENERLREIVKRALDSLKTPGVHMNAPMVLEAIASLGKAFA